MYFVTCLLPSLTKRGPFAGLKFDLSEVDPDVRGKQVCCQKQ